MLRPVVQGTLGYVGFDVLPTFAAYHVPYVDDAAREAMLRRCEQHLDALPRLAPMTFPRLADFHEQLRPLPRAAGPSDNSRSAGASPAAADHEELR